MRKLPQLILSVFIIGLVVIAVATFYTYGERAVERVIVAVLGVALLRDVVMAVGLFPADTFLSPLFFNHTQEALIEAVLKRTASKENEKVAAYGTAPGVGLNDLIALLTRTIQRFPSEITYGKQTVVHSSYYINTMEASHDAIDLDVMVRLIERLITRNGGALPDFVVAPKSGNPLLAEAFHAAFGIPCILRKSAGDKSRAQPVSSASFQMFVNFEGAHYLQRLAADTGANGKNLRGVAMDCNTSGGSELMETITEFNRLLSETGWAVTPLSEAYVLFRPDNQADIDSRFRSNQLRIYRYLDLNEDVKTALSNVEPIPNIFDKKSKNKLRKLRQTLVNQGCVRTEI